jgi:hypothetical protein
MTLEIENAKNRIAGSKVEGKVSRRSGEQAARHKESRVSILLIAMLRIQRSETNGTVVLTLSGRMDEEDVAELETLVRSEASGRRMVLDLKDVTLAGRDAIRFLERFEADGVTLHDCPRYVRELITRQRRGS